MSEIHSEQRGSYPERINGQRNFLSKNKLDEDIVERKIDDSRVQHRFGYILPNHTEDMGSFPFVE